MIRFLPLLFLPCIAMAEGLPNFIETAPQREQTDTLTLEALSATHAELSYYNTEAQVSVPGDYFMEDGEIRVRVIVGLAEGSSDEYVRVIAPEGFIAVPEYLEAADGETVTIQVMQPLF